ncbi:MAG: hypothetical protein HOV81_19030 [Kofleriaceae bacterium]|nr:hypothetical protein [Kofleriaceae bacterium]
MRSLCIALVLAACSGKKADPAPEATGSQPPPSGSSLTPPSGSSRTPIDADRPIDASPRARVERDVDTSGFSRACKADADCRLVETAPCNRCGCATTPIAASEEPRFKAAIAELGDCEAVQIWGCFECEKLAPACEAGQCIAKSLEALPPDAECHADADCVISCARQGECCPMLGCEDVVPKAKADEALAYNAEHCSAEQLAACPPPRAKADYMRPRCFRGRCVGQYRKR